MFIEWKGEIIDDDDDDFGMVDVEDVEDVEEVLAISEDRKLRGGRGRLVLETDGLKTEVMSVASTLTLKENGIGFTMG